MLKYLIKVLINKCVPKTPSVRAAEDIIQISNDNTAATLSLSQSDIYNSIYEDVKELFKSSMRAKRLSREQVLYIKQMLNEFLKPYSKYYQNRYKNDAHEIYSKLKSPFLSNVEYQKISNFILECIRIY